MAIPVEPLRNPISTFLRADEDRKQMDEVQARLAAIVESSDDAIIAKTLDSKILTWNAGAERLFGYTAEEIVGKSITLLIPPEQQHEESSIIDRIRRHDRVEHYDTVRVARDGRRIDVSLTVSPIFDSGGRVIAASSIARDITARKRAENRLATQYAVTRALAEASSLDDAAPKILEAIGQHLDWEVGVLWHRDPRHDELRCSEVWHRAGFPIPEFEAVCRDRTFARDIGLPGRVWASARANWITDVVHDDNLPRAPMAAAAGLHSAFGFPILLEGNVLGVMEFFSREVRQPDDRLLPMMAAIGSQIGQFIERRRTEQALRESEQRFRLMATMVPSMIWTAAPDGTITYANERWFEYCGLTPQENARGWPELVLHPEDYQRCLDQWNTALREGTEYEIEVRNRRHDGAYRWFMSRAVPFRDSSGAIVQWFGTTTDIDDRKRAEQTFRFLAEASRSLSELTDYHSTLQRVASLAVPAFADWCAVDMLEADGSLRRVAVTHSDPEKVQLAHELLRRYPPDPAALHGLMNVLRTGRPEWMANIPDSLIVESARDEEHLRLVRQLGLRSYVCLPLCSRGRVIGALTFVTAESGRIYNDSDVDAAQDLAHRAVIAIENATLLATLKESDRRKDEFLAMLAHELRNPLAPIRNATQILRAKTPATADLRWATDVIDRQVHQMTRLVNDLLDVSRISTGNIELRKERVDLGSVVETALEASRPLIEKWGHQLTVSTPPEPLYLDADPTRLAQVLLNLLNNAAKYTEHGGRVSLTVSRKNGHVLISVKDTGIGIPADMLPRVFDMFMQVNPGLDRAEGGLGIGLALVKRLVEMHGGAVEARSEGPGKGSEFLLRLPLPEGPAGRESQATGDDKDSALKTKSCRILVVDDNRDAADTLAMLLRMLGHEVQVAGDGLAAVDAATAFRPEVIFLDIGLPKLNGYEAARRIRQQQDGARPLLIALTGWGQDDDRRRSKEAGFDDHLTKPVEFAALQQVLTSFQTRKPNG